MNNHGCDPALLAFYLAKLGPEEHQRPKELMAPKYGKGSRGGKTFTAIQLQYCTPKQNGSMLKVRRPNISADVHVPEDMDPRDEDDNDAEIIQPLSGR